MNDRAAAARLGAGAALFAALTLIATFVPGSRLWGLHMASFLSPPARWLAVLATVGFAAWTLAGALPPRSPSEPGDATAGAGRDRRSPKSMAPGRRGKRARRAAWLHLAAWPAFLIAGGAIFWLLRARTQLLGDGAVWLGNAETRSIYTYNEPFFAVIWHSHAWVLRALGYPVDATTMAIPSIASGVMALALLAGIAGEIAEPGRERTMATALLAGLGTTAYYFGYIESYPVASVFLLAYVWLALRASRGARTLLPAGITLGAAIAVHLSLLYLLPSYALLAARSRRGPVARVAVGLVPLTAATVILAGLGFEFSEWRASLEAAFRGMRESGAADLYRRPYGPLSLQHLRDIGNALLLVAPVPALLLAARGARVIRHGSPAIWFLVAAAAPGLLLACGIVTPVAAAQDWDLYGLFLLPLGVLGVACGTLRLDAPMPERSLVGVAGLSLSALLAFVLVQADADASIARFRVVVNDRSTVSPYGRAYGNSLLDRYYRERHEYARAVPYARTALDAERGNPRYWINLGTSLYEIGRIDEATTVFEQAVRLGPEFWPAQSNLALCYLSRGRFADAVAPLRAAAALDPSKPETLHDLGFALFQIGQADSAYAVWADLTARFPHYDPGSGRR